MSWQIAGHYSSSGIIPAFTDTSLLVGETDGLAVDFTNTTKYYPSWDVAADQWYSRVQVRTSSVDVYSDPQTFFTNNGTSPKLIRDNGAYGLAWAPHNLALRSQELDNAAWSYVGSTLSADSAAAPDGTSTADTFTAKATTSAHGVGSAGSISSLGGAIHTASAYFKYSNLQYAYVLFGSFTTSNQWIQVAADIQNGSITQTQAGAGGTYISSSITSVGGGWYRVSVTGSVADAGLFVEVSGIDTGTPASANFGETSWTGHATEAVIAWGVQLNRGIAATEYIATTSAAAIGLPISYGEGLWVELAATNIALQSQDISTTWTNTNSSETTDAVTAPDGSVTADKLKVDTTNSTHSINQDVTVSSGAAYMFSVYLKAGEHTWAQVQGDAGADCYFNLGTGAVGTATGATGTIESIGNGWYRCKVQWTTGDTTASLKVLVATADATNSFAGANTTDGIYMWGAQLETGSVATSHIPTVGSSVTRAADAINVATSSFPFSATVGNVNASFVILEINKTNADRLWTLDDGTSNEVFDVEAVTADNPDSWGFSVIDGGVAQVAPGTTKTGSLSLSGNKVSAAWAANDFSILADGGSEVNDTSGTLPTVTSLKLGYSTTALRELNGFIKKLSYVPRNLSQSEMQSKQSAM